MSARIRQVARQGGGGRGLLLGDGGVFLLGRRQ